MKTYLLFIKRLQTTLLAVSISGLTLLSLLSAYMPPFSPRALSVLYTVSLASVFFVMSVRPLADLFPDVPWIRPLVVLRKGFGVLSASIIVSLFLGKVIASGGAYLSTIFSPAYWSLTRYTVLAHLGDLTAIVLLCTSNVFSKRVLGPWWKRIQKLAYVYFYAGALYEALALGSVFALRASIIVTVLVFSAFIRNRFVRVRALHTA
jgi:hypothetical protein